MASIRPKVPLFNDSTNPTNPTGFVNDFVNYALGAGIAIAAIVAGQWLVSEAGEATGVDDSNSLEVV